MSSLATARDRVLDRLTPTIMTTKLRAMAAMLNLRPSLRHHLRDLDPVAGSFAFAATLQFVTEDDSAAAHVVFAGGKMKVHTGAAARPDLTVRFKGREQMRDFFAGKDTMSMLLDNTLVFSGNLSYLLKFGHLSAAVTLGDRKRRGRDPRTGVRPPTAATWQPPRQPECRPRPAAVGASTAGAAQRPSSAPELAPGEAEHVTDPSLGHYQLSDFPRLERLLRAFRTTQPEICTERALLLTEQMLASRRAGRRVAPVVRQAEAIAHILGGKQAIINDDDLLAGTVTSKRIGIPIFPELGGVGIWPELLTMETREQNPYRISDEEIAILDRRVFPFWMEENVREWTKLHAANREPLELDERFVLYFMWKTQAATHTVIDVPRALSRGLCDIRAEAEAHRAAASDADRRAFYEATILALDAVLGYAARLAARAEALLGKGGFSGADGAKRREALEEMARACRKVPAQPAETLFEAVQALWILFVAQHQENMGAGLVLGRLDTWLEPYFRRELDGVTDPVAKERLVKRAIELCGALMLKATDHLPMVPDVGNRLFGGSSENQVITLGGVTPEGGSAVCDMTWIFLKATEMLRLKDPNVNARYAPGVNSKAYLWRLCEVNALTRATPSLHNDDAVVKGLLSQGFSLADARDWTATGCVEPTSCGRHFGHTNCMMLNLVAPLEMALNNGRHPILGRQVGPETGAVESFTCYEEFWKAYGEQLTHVIRLSTEANNLLGRAHQEIKPTPLLSALFTGPMEKGRDVTAGGAQYNTSGTAMVGLTDVVDSLVAIRRLVFEEKRLTLRQLVAALAVDFVGHEALEQELRRKVPKFGQDDALTNAVAGEVQELVLRAFSAQEHYRGGKYLPGYWSMSNHVAFGLLSGALPSGRRRGKPFTPGLTPAAAANAPLTDQIRAVARLDPTRMPNNIAFNVKVVPGADDDHPTVVDRMAAYAAAYFELGGMQMQFNVVSSETLREAMRDPDSHRDLLVRISGYNAYFVELNRDIQLEVVERMEHPLSVGAPPR